MAVHPPYWPPRDVKFERAVGRFIIAWNVLEWPIDSAIHDLMRTDWTMAMKVTANLAIRAKLDLAHALYEEVRGGERYLRLPPDLDKRFDDLVNETAAANAEMRIPIVHGQPFSAELEPEAFTFWIKWSARKGGMKGAARKLSAAAVDRFTGDVRALVERWHGVRTDMAFALDIFATSDADRRLSREPGEEDHPHLHIRLRPADQPAKQRQPQPKRPSPQGKSKPQN